MALSDEHMRTLVLLRDKRYEGDLSDPVQRILYNHNLTNIALDKVEEDMRREGLI